MGLKIKAVKDVEKDIKFMTNLEVDFVSLVPHGANKEPFRVIKSVKGGNMENYVVQSLIFADGADVEGIAQKSDLGWLSELSMENVEKNAAYSRIVQIDASQFDHDTLQLLKLDESGVWTVVGKLAENSEKADDAIVVSEKQVKEIKSRDEKNFFKTPVTDERLLEGWYIPTLTAGELFQEELFKMEDVLFSVLRQEGMDNKKKKATITASIDAFKGFVSMLMDSTPESAIKVVKKTSDRGGEDMDLFKTKEDFEKAVDERVQAKVDEALKNHAPAEGVAPEPTDTEATGSQKTEEGQEPSGETGQTEPSVDTKSEDAETPSWAKALTEDIKSFKEDITNRISKMENSPSTEPANGTDSSAENTQKSDTGEPAAATVEDDDFELAGVNPKYRGKFTGLFGDLRS